MDGNLTQNIQKYIPVIGEYANVHLVLKTQISYSSQDLKSNPSGLISAEAVCLSFSSLLISAVTHTSCLFYSESAWTRGGDGVVAWVRARKWP